MDYIALGDYTIKLVASVINNTEVPAVPENINMIELYKFTRKHLLSSLVYEALKKLDLEKILILPFYEDYKEFSLREIKFSAQTSKLLSDFEKNEITSMPFKGADIKKFYPCKYMRPSVDVDILIKDSDITVIDKIMTDNGFSVLHNTDDEIAYIKNPFFNYELHKNIFEEDLSYHKYFVNLLDKMPTKEGMLHTKEMSYEEMYIYNIVHFYKHFVGGGAGIRFLVDLYLIEKNTPSNANINYIHQVLKEIGMHDFNKRMSELSRLIFESDLEKRSDKEKAVCKYFYLQGCFGGDSGCILETVKRKSKKHNSLKFFYYLWYKFMFQERRFKYYPVLKKHYYLLPFCFAHCLFKNLILNRKRIIKDYKAYLKYETFLDGVFKYCNV